MAAQPPALPPSLADLQKQFLDAVMRGDATILDHIPANSRTTNATLLGVYQHAYAARLVEVVRNDHPVLVAYMGDEAFGAMARRYVAAHPSRHPNARWFASKLPEFLAASDDFCAVAELTEIAALERALGNAFDAEDAPVLDVVGLAKHPPETWGDLAFVPHPSVSLLRCTANTFEMWRALKDESAPPPAKMLPAPETVLVWRRGATPRVRIVSPEEAMMWSEAARGVAFGRLCELVAVFGGSDDADARSAEYLLGWLNEGMLKGVV
jgi:putative DNA-binding protein